MAPKNKKSFDAEEFYEYLEHAGDGMFNDQLDLSEDFDPELDWIVEDQDGEETL